MLANRTLRTWEKYTLGIAFFICLAPFLYLFSLAYPVADDITRSMITWSNYFDRIWSWLMNHNGRYFNAILVLIPLYNNFIVYQLINFCFFLFFAKSLYDYQRTEERSGYNSLIFGAVLFYLFLEMPNHGHLFYWYATQTAYCFSIAIAFILLRYLNNISKRKEITLGECFKIVLLIFMGMGSHEMFIVASMFSLGLFLIYNFLSFDNGSRLRTVGLLIYGMLNAAAVRYMPGSMTRQNRVTKPTVNDFGYALGNSIENGFGFMLDQLANPSLWVFTALLILLSVLFRKDNSRKRQFSFIDFWSLCIPVLVICLCFVYYYSFGAKSGIIARVRNMIFIYFILGYSGIVTLLARRISVNLPDIILQTRSLVVIVVLGGSFALGTNSTTFVSDWSQDVFSDFRSEISYRKDVIRGHIDADDLLQIDKFQYFKALNQPSKLLYFNENVGMVKDYGVKGIDHLIFSGKMVDNPQRNNRLYDIIMQKDNLLESKDQAPGLYYDQKQKTVVFVEWGSPSIDSRHVGEYNVVQKRSVKKQLKFKGKQCMQIGPLRVCHKQMNAQQLSQIDL